MSSPVPTLLLCLAYYYLVVVAGPRFMANRPAFELRRVLMAYNIFQILFNGWMFYEIGMSGWFTGQYNFFCQPVDYSETEVAMRGLRVGYWFFISKFIDFFDTFFFVLRKKNNQITVLHLYHHGLLPILLWPGVRYVCGGHSSFFALLNTLVHVVMYFYYLVAAMGPRFERFIWWKKYLTAFQIAQFILASVHCFQLVFKNECGFPTAFSVWIGLHELGFLGLFLHFYLDTYRTRKAEAPRNGEINNNIANKKQL